MGWQEATASEDVGVASWVGPRLHPFGQDVGAVVPTGFAGYARVENRQGLAEVLEKHTGTPQRCWFCLWEGYGYLYPGRSVWLREGTPAPPRPPRISLRLPRRRPKHARKLVRLPDRDYLLFTGSVMEGAGWQDGPNLWWPDDRAWCVASEIDLEYTLVGGTSALIDEILERSDARRTRVDDPL